jgi:hypothetical protein
MNKSFIILISLLFGFSAMYSQTKEIQQKELYQKCINTKKYFKQYASYTVKNLKSIKGYSLSQNIKEFVLINALQEMTLQIESKLDGVSSTINVKSEGDNSKSTTEFSRIIGSYIYSKHILVNVATTKFAIKNFENNTYEETFQIMTQLILKEDTIRYSSVNIRSNDTESYNDEFNIGKNKNWFNDVINELKFNGMEFNFIEDKNKVELCISLKKDLIKK